MCTSPIPTASNHSATSIQNQHQQNQSTREVDQYINLQPSAGPRQRSATTSPAQSDPPPNTSKRTRHNALEPLPRPLHLPTLRRQQRWRWLFSSTKRPSAPTREWRRRDLKPLQSRLRRLSRHERARSAKMDGKTAGGAQCGSGDGYQAAEGDGGYG